MGAGGNRRKNNAFSLSFRAGPAARAWLSENGFDATAFGTIAGASGGAKWLVLSQLDRVIVRDLLPGLEAPVHLIGTSIGAWRFACYGQADPLAAIERFEAAYIGQRYSPEPGRAEITAKSREILRAMLGDDGAGEILAHPTLRTHVLSVRARHLAASDNAWLLGASLLGAASLNAVSRRTLGLFFERALFFDPRELPPFYDARGFPMQKVPLTADNIEDAVVSTGSIPLVLDGVRDIRGAAPGVYRDGGIIDYHLDLPLSDRGRLTLFPHFYGHIVPGWFDKRLAWRRPQPAHTDRVLLISPAPEFVAGLPGGRIPDRHDFRRYPADERIRIWRRVVDECRRLGDELAAVIESGRVADRLEPL